MTLVTPLRVTLGHPMVDPTHIKSGYNLHGRSFITLPYADDFCLITTNKRTHQNFINNIHNNINTMGMRLKPSKCRSFSLSGGKPTPVHYKIGEDIVPTIAEEEQKFLGKLLFFSGKSSETYNHIKETLLSKLKKY